MISREKGSSRIVGLQAGEIHISLNGADLQLEGKFALIRDDGDRCGPLTKRIWSERTIEALQVFLQKAEEEAADEIFDAVEGAVQVGQI